MFVFQAQSDRLPTVDLTDDSLPEQLPVQKEQTPKTINSQRTLPYRCDLCPAQYPNAIGLNKHRQSFHKTNGTCEFGIPLINFQQPGILQKLSSIGIFNYIPISGAAPNQNLAMPVVNVNSLKQTNIGAIGASTVLTLGPIRSLPRPQINNNVPVNK